MRGNHLQHRKDPKTFQRFGFYLLGNVTDIDVLTLSVYSAGFLKTTL